MKQVHYHLTPNVDEFWQSAQSFLLNDENRHTQLISIVQLVQKKKREGFSFGMILDQSIHQGVCLGVVIITPRGHLYCSDLTSEHVESMAHKIGMISGISPIQQIHASPSTAQRWIDVLSSDFEQDMLQYLSLIHI